MVWCTEIQYLACSNVTAKASCLISDRDKVEVMGSNPERGISKIDNNEVVKDWNIQNPDEYLYNRPKDGHSIRSNESSARSIARRSVLEIHEYV